MPSTPLDGYHLGALHENTPAEEVCWKIQRTMYIRTKTACLCIDFCATVFVA